MKYLKFPSLPQMPDSKRHFLKHSKDYSSRKKSFFLRNSLLLPWVLIKISLFSCSTKRKQNEGSYVHNSLRPPQAVSNIFLPLSTLKSVRTLEVIWNLKSCLVLKPSEMFPNFLVQDDPAKYCFARVICHKTLLFAIMFAISSTLNYLYSLPP